MGQANRYAAYATASVRGNASRVSFAPTPRNPVEAARRLEISLNRLNEIVLGERGITADTALRLARILKTSPQFWMRLQADWDLHEALERRARKVSGVETAASHLRARSLRRSLESAERDQ